MSPQPPHSPNPPPARRPRCVHKFGGVALADGAAVLRSVQIVARARAAAGGLEPPPVVVVSALAGVTRTLDQLARQSAAAGLARPERVAPLGRARLEPIRVRHRSVLRELGLDPELCDRHLRDLAAVLAAIEARGALAPAELDFVLSFGERLSARIFARTLSALGVEAAPVDAYDLGLVTDSNHGFARPLEGFGPRLSRALESFAGIPVVTGFLACDARGNVTTLGPNGSDYTAALIAEGLGAAELVLWKAVSGILTADPELVPAARLVPELGWDDAEALARAGADVLHPESLGPVRRARIPVALRDVAAPEAPGTRIVGLGGARGVLAVAVRSIDANRAVLTLVAQGLAPDLLSELLLRRGIRCEPSDCARGQAVILSLADAARAAREVHEELFASELRQAPRV